MTPQSYHPIARVRLTPLQPYNPTTRTRTGDTPRKVRVRARVRVRVRARIRVRVSFRVRVRVSFRVRVRVSRVRVTHR